MAEFDVAALSSRQIYKLLIGCVVPRPIAWVSTVSSSGTRNIAPFSYFNAVSSQPPMLGFSVAEPKVPGKAEKDTLTCLRDTGDFVVNLASAALLDRLIVTSIEYEAGVDEFSVAGLTPIPGVRVTSPRIGEASASFECRLHTVVPLGLSSWVIGRVVHAHVRDDLVDERLHIDAEAFEPIGRMPGPAYTTKMNVVTRAARLADAADGSTFAIEWLGDETASAGTGSDRPATETLPPTGGGGCHVPL